MMDIYGAGGGKSGSGGGGLSEDPDTLSSIARARFVDLIGEGEIVGLVNNEYSIYLDDVPLKNVDGTPNYRPFRWSFRNGTQSQTVMPGFAGTQQEVAVGVKLLQTSGKLIRSVPDAGADSVRVTVGVNSLIQTSGDGKVTGTTVKYKISARVAGGSWTVAKEDTIDGKTGSRYQRATEVGLTVLGPGPYEVAVERITSDAASSLLQDEIYWDSYAIINYEQLTYPNSSLIGIELDARYFSQIPTRRYHVRGLRVRVPMNYDPVSRRYATTGPGTTLGAWDGTFKIAYTDNPAWCYYDLVTNTRYGLGRRITDAQISKWDMYTIGKYCDERVPTGLNLNVFESVSSANFAAKGSGSVGVPITRQNTEPRFTLNCVINTRDDAHRVLNQLSSVFRGMTYWANGSVVVTQDRPTGPKHLFSNSNVKDGKFHYEGSGKSQRNTVAIVAWNDPAEDFRQRFEYIEDREGIKRYGVRAADMLAFGCTSKSQARRLGLWYLYTQRLEDGAIHFVAGMDAAQAVPGDTALIQDSNKSGVRYGGRIVSATTTQVTLDTTLTLTTGIYTLSVKAKDGTVVSKQVTIGSSGDYTVLTVDSAYSAAPGSPSMWTLASSTVSELLVRIVGVRPVDKGQYEVSAVKNVTSKYNAVDFGMKFVESNYSVLSVGPVPQVSGLIANERSYKPTVKSPVKSDLDISWDLLSDPMVRGYSVKVTGSNKVSYTMPETPDPTATLTGLTPGLFTVTVTAINVFGNRGTPKTITKTVTGIDTTPPADVVSDTITYTVEPTIGVRLSWEEVEDYIDIYEIRRGTAWGSSTLVARVKGTSHPVGLLTGNVTFLIKARDTSGNYSVNAATVVVDVAVPGMVSPSYALSGMMEVLSWNVPASAQTIDEYRIYYGATFATATLLTSVRGTSLQRRADFLGARTYWIQAADVAGGLSNPAPVSVEIFAPGSITSYYSQVVDNNVLLFWSKPVTGNLPIARYEVRRGATWAGGTVLGSNSDSTFTAVFEQQSGDYTYWINAYDTANNSGTPVAIPAKVNQPPDYVLRTSIDSVFAGTKTNMVLSEGALVGPLNTSHTWADHFTTNSWTTPQDQITAGYPLYAQPSTTSGSYDESFDYGSVLPATTITASLGYTVIAGTVTVACQIYYKTNIGDSWTAATAGVTSVLATNFRYVRVVWTFTCTAGANTISVTSFNLKLSSKLKTDNGTFTITDANAGVFVPFNISFIDARTPIAQADGTTPLIVIVSFTDVPNPTGATYYLHNPATGVKVTGSGSWTARGH